MSPEHSTSASKHWRVWGWNLLGFFFFFPFWLLAFGCLTSEASHEEWENSRVGGKIIHLGRYCMGQAGTELPVLSLRVLAMPPSLENSRFPGQACSKLAGLTVPMHCSKPDISAGSASTQPSPPASFWQQLPRYFEIKRLKKHERNGADCPRYVLDAFCPYKNVMMFFRRIFNLVWAIMPETFRYKGLFMEVKRSKTVSVSCLVSMQTSKCLSNSFHL